MHNTIKINGVDFYNSVFPGEVNMCLVFMSFRAPSSALKQKNYHNSPNLSGYLSAQSFVRLLKLLWREYDIVAMNEWKKKCVGLQRTWVSKRTVYMLYIFDDKWIPSSASFLVQCTHFFRPLTVSITWNHLHSCFMLNKRKHVWELKCVFNYFCSLPQTRVKVRNEDRSFCKSWYWIGEGFEPDVLDPSETGRLSWYRRVAQWWGVQTGGHSNSHYSWYRIYHL